MQQRTEAQEKEEEKDLVMYWHINYWDRPLEGVAMYKGRPVYFKLIEDDNEDDGGDPEETEEKPTYDEPTYNLYGLTDAQYGELEDQHNEFGRLVGRHTDHRPGVHAPYDASNTAGFREWYDSEDDRKLSFCPTQHCPLVAIVPWTAFANYRRPTSSTPSS